MDRYTGVPAIKAIAKALSSFDGKFYKVHERANALLVYIVIASEAQIEKQGVIDVYALRSMSQPDIAAECNMSAGQLQRAVKILIDSGLITTIRPSGRARLEWQCMSYIINPI